MDQSLALEFEGEFNNLSETQAANAADFLEKLATEQMPPPPQAVKRRKKTGKLSNNKRRTVEVPINQRTEPEPGQRTLCELPSVTAACSHKATMDQKQRAEDGVLDKIPSGVPFVEDFEYIVVKYKNWDTGFMIRQGGQTVSVTTSALNEMIRRNRIQK